MKTQKILKIIAIALAILTVLFVILSKFVDALKYVSISLALVLILIIIAYFVVDVCISKQLLQKEFEEYFAQKAKEGKLDMRDDKQKKVLRKSFKKENKGELARPIWIILGLVVLFASVFSALLNNILA